MRDYTDLRIELISLGRDDIAVVGSAAAGESNTEMHVQDWSMLGRLSEKLDSKNIYQPELLNLGSHLGSLLVAGNVEQLFTESIRSAGAENGVRVRLVIHDERLASMAWEYAHINIPDRMTPLSPYLVLDPRLSLVRHSPQPRPAPTIAPTDAVRILAVTAPDVAGFDTLSGSDANVIRQLYEARMRARGSAPEWHLDTLRNPSTDQLLEALEQPWDVFYFAGHATMHMGSPSLVLPVGTTGHALVEAEKMAAALLRSGTKVAVLNACKTGVRKETQPWRGVAAQLIELAVPAVIAMQHPIEDSHAAAFAEGLFRGLLSGSTVDEAVSLGRRAVLSLGVLLDWGVPVLYTRSGDLRLVDPSTATDQPFVPVVLKQPQSDDRSTGPIAPLSKKSPEFGFRTSSATLAGREKEVAQLSEILHDGMSDGVKNRLRVVLMSGASGIGKSALLYAAETLASDLGYQVVRVVCEPFHEGMSFFPIRDLMRQLSESNEVVELIARRYGRGSLNTQLAQMLQDADTDPSTRREALIATFANLVCGLSTEPGARPLLVVVDDLERVDAGTADALLCLIGRMNESNAVVVASYRVDDRVGAGYDALKNLLAAAARHRSTVMRLKIDPLPRDAIPALAHQVLGAPCRLSAAFYDRLYSETEGNPLFAREILRSLAVPDPRKGAILRFVNGAWEAARHEREWQMPDSVEQVIKERFDSLARDERTELELAAVIGRRFAFALVVALSSQSEDRLLRFIETFLNLDIIRETTHEDESFEFSHGKIRDVLYQSMSRMRRRRLHKQVAELLELVGDHAPSEDRVGLLAEHLFEAHEYDRAAPVLIEAARVSAAIFDLSSAIRQFEKARVAMSNATVELAEPAQQIELEYGDVLKLTGEYVQAEAVLRRLIRDDPAPEYLGWSSSHLGDVLQLVGRSKEARALYEAAKISGIEQQDFRLLAEVSASLAELLGRDYSREFGVNAAAAAAIGEIYRAELADGTRYATLADDRSSLARAFRNEALFQSRYGDTERALELFQSALSLGETRLLFHQIRVPMSRALRIAGRTTEALQLVEEVLDWSIQTGVRRSEAIARQHRAIILVEQLLGDGVGRSDDHAALRAFLVEFEHALDLHLEVGFDQGALETHNSIGELLLVLGDLDGALGHFWAATPRLDGSRDVIRARAAELASKGEVVRSRRMVDALALVNKTGTD